MNFFIQLFARAKDLAGAERISIQLPKNATVADLRRALGEAYPKLKGLLAHSAVAIDNQYADDTATVPANAELALLPPVSGG